MILRAQRIQMNTRVLLEFSGLYGFTGTTIDFSESGVYFITHYKASSIKVGDEGHLHIIPKGLRSPLICCVTRITDDGIAIHYKLNHN